MCIILRNPIIRGGDWDLNQRGRIGISIRGEDWDLNQRGRIGISLTGLTPPHLCAYSKTGPVFPTPYVVLIFMFNCLR
jgi:hypothetical protein